MPSIGRRRLLGIAGASLAGTVPLRPRFLRSERTDDEPAAAWPHPRRTAGNAAVASDPGPGDDGAVAWRRRLDTYSRPELAGLALAGEDLLVPTHRALVSLNPEDGAVRWRFRRSADRVDPEYDYEQLDSEPRVRGDHVFVAIYGTLYAVHRDTRRLRWRYPQGAGDGVHLIGNTVCCGASIDGDDELVALDTETGYERWRRSGRWIPQAGTGDLLVAAAYDSGRVHGLDVDDGARRWQSDARITAASLSRGQVVATDAAVLVQRRDGRIAVLDPTTGHRRATLGEPAESTYRASIAVDQDDDGEVRLYHARPDEGTVSRYDLGAGSDGTEDGTPTWRRDGLSLEFGLAVGRGAETAYLSTESGLVALDAATGDERFRVRVDGVAEDERHGSTPVVAGRRVIHRVGNVVYGVESR